MLNKFYIYLTNVMFHKTISDTIIYRKCLYFKFEIEFIPKTLQLCLFVFCKLLEKLCEVVGKENYLKFSEHWRHL